MNGGFGVILGSILTQRRCNCAWLLGRGDRICDFPIMSQTCYTVGFVCVCVCVCMEIFFALSHARNKYFCPDKFCRPNPPRDLIVVPSIIPFTSSLCLWNEMLLNGTSPPSPSPVYEDFYPTHHRLMKIVTGE